LPRLPRILLGVFAGLPLRVLHALGTVLGWAIYGTSPTYRRHLRENLKRAGYPDASVRRAAIAHAGRMLAETPAMWLRPQDEVAALVREVPQATDYLQQMSRSVTTPLSGGVFARIASHVRLQDRFFITERS